MKVLIACEESQEVCKAFRAKGHEAYSCDIQMCSGGHPEWHICNDVLDIINGNTDFFTCDGKQHTVETWDMIIAHPPCTYLTNVATRHYSLKCTPAEKVVERMKHREESIVFFMQIVSANAPKIAVENPIGRMNTVFRKADQIIHPYMFSNGPEDSEQFVTKATCLWLKGLPVLRPTYTGDKLDNGSGAVSLCVFHSNVKSDECGALTVTPTRDYCRRCAFYKTREDFDRGLGNAARSLRDKGLEPVKKLDYDGKQYMSVRPIGKENTDDDKRGV